MPETKMKKILVGKNEIGELMVMVKAIVVLTSEIKAEELINKMDKEKRNKIIAVAADIFNKGNKKPRFDISEEDTMSLKHFIVIYQNMLKKKHDNTEVNNGEDEDEIMVLGNQAATEDTCKTPQETITNKQVINIPIIKRLNEKPIPKGWFRVEDYAIEPVIIIKKEGSSGVQIFDEMNLVMQEENSPLKKITQYVPRDDKVIAYCQDLNTMNQAIEYINGGVNNWEVSVPKLFPPKIKILNCSIDVKKECYDWTDFIKKLRKRNDWSEEAKIVFCFANSPRNNKFHDIVLEITPNIRDMIENNRGEICIENQKRFVIDHFDIRRCVYCQQYDHVKKDCQNSKKCPLCSDKHDKCPIKGKKSEYKCPSCNGDGHSSLSKNCPKYKKALNRTMIKTNYKYSWVMAKPSPDDW